ncbi:transposase [Candidatus Poribacteria bacterium]|nr:MAG: transposase [Candidatus Poribacteria bacterium]
MRTYKYKIQKHKRNRYLQKDLHIISHVHNHFVALWQRHYKIYGHCEGYKRPSAFRMIKHLTKLKRLEKYQHWRIPYSWCLQECVQRIDSGWQNFFEGRAKRAPKFRSRHKYKSMTFDGSQVKIEDIDKANGCPVAKIRINRRWYRFWYSRPIEGNIKRATVKKDFVGDWYITITTDAQGLETVPKTGKTAGFDFGIKDFLTCSDGTKYQSPEFYKSASTQTKRASQALSRKQKGSNNRNRARKDLARVHRKINRQREDHHWKLALELVRKFDTCFFEDLNLDGMKRLWGRKVSDYAFGDFMLKTKWQAQKRGKRIETIDRWTPTSKVCHTCGQIQMFFDLSIRNWYCHHCKIHHDRDINAAINIHKVGASTFGGEDVRLASASNPR